MTTRHCRPVFLLQLPQLGCHRYMPEVPRLFAVPRHRNLAPSGTLPKLQRTRRSIGQCAACDLETVPGSTSSAADTIENHMACELGPTIGTLKSGGSKAHPPFHSPIHDFSIVPFLANDRHIGASQLSLCPGGCGACSIIQVLPQQLLGTTSSSCCFPPTGSLSITVTYSLSRPTFHLTSHFVNHLLPYTPVGHCWWNIYHHVYPSW